MSMTAELTPAQALSILAEATEPGASAKMSRASFVLVDRALQVLVAREEFLTKAAADLKAMTVPAELESARASILALFPQ